MNAIYGCRQQAGSSTHNNTTVKPKTTTTKTKFASHKYILFECSLIAVYVASACMFSSHPLWVCRFVCVCCFFFGLFVFVAVCRLLENAYFVDTMGRYVIKDSAWSRSVFSYSEEEASKSSTTIANLCFVKQTWWFLIFDSTHLFGTCCCWCWPCFCNDHICKTPSIHIKHTHTRKIYALQCINRPSADKVWQIRWNVCHACAMNRTKIFLARIIVITYQLGCQTVQFISSLTCLALFLFRPAVVSVILHLGNCAMCGFVFAQAFNNLL